MQDFESDVFWMAFVATWRAASRLRLLRRNYRTAFALVPFPPVMKFPPFLLTSRNVFSAFEGGEDSCHALRHGAIRVTLGLGF